MSPTVRYGMDIRCLAKDAIASRSKSNYFNGLDLCKSLGAVVTNTET